MCWWGLDYSQVFAAYILLRTSMSRTRLHSSMDMAQGCLYCRSRGVLDYAAHFVSEELICYMHKLLSYYADLAWWICLPTLRKSSSNLAWRVRSPTNMGIEASLDAFVALPMRPARPRLMNSFYETSLMNSCSETSLDEFVLRDFLDEFVQQDLAWWIHPASLPWWVRPARPRVEEYHSRDYYSDLATNSWC